MKGLIKLMLVLGLIFASTFLLLNTTGVISVGRIEYLLESAQQASPWLIGTVVIVLLFVDLFVAMPTLTIMLLSGFFLGTLMGAMFSVLGLLLAGISGYALSYRYGDRLVSLLIKKESERQVAIDSFQQIGVVTILLSRAMPILPEVSACMAGLTKMRFVRFVSVWLVSIVPYAAIAAYGGSISSLSNPKPAILVGIGLTSFFWLAWFFYKRFFPSETASVPMSK